MTSLSWVCVLARVDGLPRKSGGGAACHHAIRCERRLAANSFQGAARQLAVQGPTDIESGAN